MWQEEKRAVVEASLEVLRKGLVVGTCGNISLRLPSEDGRELLAITPTSRYYDTLGVDDIPVVDFSAHPVEGSLAPSVETMMHICIYRARKDVCAVIHTHSAFATVVAVAGIELPPICDDQIAFIGGEIKVAKYAPAGTIELAENVNAALADRNAALMANHGMVAVGRTMREALTVCELAEKTAKVYIYASALGKVNLVPEQHRKKGLG